MSKSFRYVSAATVVLLAVGCLCCASYADLVLTAAPMDATINSVWTFQAVWTDSEGRFPSNDPTVPSTPGDYGIIWLQGISGTWGPAGAYDGIPMFYVRGNPYSGAIYEAYASGGLNMSNPIQWPNRLDPQGNLMYIKGTLDTADSLFPQRDITAFPDTMGYPNSLLYGPTLGRNIGLDPNDPNSTGADPLVRRPIWYAPGLRGNPILASVMGAMYNPPAQPGDPPVDPTIINTAASPITPVVHGSSRLLSYIDFGGGGPSAGIVPYPEEGAYPRDFVCDPLDIEPVLSRSMSSPSPDDGSSSHEFIFRVHYRGMPPLGWGISSGVVLYLDLANTGDYIPYPMVLEKGAATDGVYMTRITTRNVYWYTPAGSAFPGPYAWAYRSLPIGTFHYFLAAACDSLRFLMEPAPPLVLTMQPVPAEWGAIGAYSNGLDPRGSRAVTGFSEIDRAAHRRFSDPIAKMEKDTQIYVDRVDYAPGLFENPESRVPYIWKCSEHPRVSCELSVPYADDLGVSYYDRSKYGAGRFFGTLWPYKRMVNPLMVGTVTYVNDNVGMVPSSRSEFSGSSANQEVEFRIMWRQIDGQAPTKMQVFINNANTRTKVAGVSADVVGGVPTDQNADYTYKGYTMVPDDPNGNFYNGVWFRFRTKDLKPGPHTYYFEASDTEQTCIWPRRPDYYVYPPDGTWYMDYWVPTQSPMPKSQAELATYDDNDYCPGPYVNSAPVLSDYSVTPTTGKMGQTFTYRVKYTDVDGESPYSAYVWIQTADGAAFQKYAMTPEITINPTVDNRALFKNGVYYKFDTGTLQGIALHPGTRRYYFEFTDNWGRAVEVNDRIPGDTVNVTSDGRKEKDGPTIDGPQPPTLTQGKVESADGTKNSATMWKFSVKYSDANNDSPQGLKLFVGLLQPDGKTVLWDSGHTMSPEDPADNVYTDGAIYYYMTRLEGQKVTRLVNGFPDDQPKRYFYSFLAYDGSAWATWTPAVDPVNNPPSPYYRPSDSACTYVFQALTGSNGAYTMPIPSALSSKDIVPIVGPMLTDLPVPRGELSDAQLYTSPDTPSAPDGLPVLTNSHLMMADDQKSGWTDEPRYSMMKGNANDVDGKPSDVYVVPATPDLLASVDGVYTTIEGMIAATTNPPPPPPGPTLAGSVDTTNYYDGSALTETCPGIVDPMQQDGTVVLVNWNGGSVLSHDDDWRIGEIVSVAWHGAPVTVVGTTINAKGQIILDTTNGHLNPGTRVTITFKRAGYTPGNSKIWLTTALPADNVGKTVFIKYNDIRFTHRVRGATQIDDDGFTQLYLYGQGSPAISIKTGTAQDPYSGFIGVWKDLDRTWPNYFNPSIGYGILGDGDLSPGPVPLTANAPDGTWELYGYYYQFGDYNIDRFSRTIRYTSKHQDFGTPLYATYMWGLPMEDKDGVIWVGQNTSPHLRNGKVIPKNGARNTGYVYSVDYQDLDGPNGQAPEYVRVYIDGVPHNMAPVGSGGTPPYKDGVTYTYTASPMSAQSHSYHFDASDGASVVWLDYDKVNQIEVEHRYDEITYQNNLDQPVRDFDGPWVNDPPTLTKGAATPNPAAPGTIGTNDSVDYTVTYMDLDNDPPFVYDSTIDATGSGILGGPIVWIDGGTTDFSYLAKADSANPLSPDPLQPSKMRILNVDVSSIVASDGSSTTWVTNQLAGKLLQITTGANRYRVFLIQSNTADSLAIATDDLKAELAPYFDSNGLLIKDITFRINGLEMRKDDPNDSTYTDGVNYRITVPRLTVGTHKFHFTTRSRVTPPVWWTDPILPYSVEVRFPATGDTSGPTVVSSPPSGNTAPVLTAPDLLGGPSIKMATQVDATHVMLDTSAGGNWSTSAAGNVRQVDGVYMTPLLGDYVAYPTNYLAAPVSTFPADYSMVTASLPVIAGGTELVGLGAPAADSTIGGVSLMKVTPDSAGSIGTVLGVYLTSAMTGTNYYDSFDGTKILMNAPLPSGTTQVYIDYTLKNGATPPVYVKYYRKTTVNTVFLSGDPITYRISYNDLDNDPPTYHGGVQGYVKLLFSGITTPRFLMPLAMPSDYLTPVPLSVTITDTPEGTHKYIFLGSDGYDPQHQVRFPVAANPPPIDANDPVVKVNYKPVLSAASVDPMAGLPSVSFTFTVTYRDTDGAGTTPSVNVRLIKIGDEVGNPVQPVELPLHAMAAGSGAIPTGQVYSMALPSGTLTAGTYLVAFEAYDGTQAAAPITLATALKVRLSNAKPEIIDAAVNPVAGKTSVTFYYTAYYGDPDGDPPVGYIVGLPKYEGLVLVIDKGTSKARTVKMTKVVGQTAAYTDPAGVLFRSDPVLGSSLGMGSHTYEVQASDGTLSADPKAGTGPILLVPFFDQLRIVSAGATDPFSAPAVTNPNVGDNVLIVGLIKFPKNAVTGKPSNDQSITFTVTKPDGSAFSLKGSMTMQDDATDPNYWVGEVAVMAYQRGGDPALVNGQNLTMAATGEWTFSAKRDGSASWDPAQTDSVIDGQNDNFKAVVGGPMRTIAVKDPLNPATSAPLVDMVTPAMVIADGDVGRIFGFDRVLEMAIVRWDTLTSSYYRYGTGIFPLLQPGEAVWIKPKLGYTAESISQADIDSGLLSNGIADVLLDASQQYRVLHVYSKAYPLAAGSTNKAPVSILLHAGWNQFGNIFFNYKKLAGLELTPKQDLGIPFSELKVNYLNQTLSIADAMTAGWIRDYAWRFDAPTRQYVLVSATATGAERVLKAWSGYWIKTLVDCELIIDPNTTYNGGTLSAASIQSLGVNAAGDYDTPPPAP